MIDKWKQRARQLEIEVYAIYLAYRDPRVPWHARAVAAAVAAYAFSPIDLIPDFIPVLGYLDDLVIVPLGVWLALKMIPAPVLAECRDRARGAMAQGQSIRRAGAAIVAALWLLAAVIAVLVIVKWRL